MWIEWYELIRNLVKKGQNCISKKRFINQILIQIFLDYNRVNSLIDNGEVNYPKLIETFNDDYEVIHFSNGGNHSMA